MIESGSSIQCFMTCPKKYWFTYEKLLSPNGYNKHFGYGSFIHAFVESHTGVGVKERPLMELNRYLTDFPAASEQIKADYNQAAMVSDIWLSYWGQGVHPFRNEMLKFINSEFEWIYDVDAAKGYYHTGKSDGVIHSKKYDLTFLYELKTAADRGRDTYLHKLLIDKQISSNLKALEKSNLSPAGVVYDIIWKPGLIRKTGRKNSPDETAEEFSRRIVEAMNDEPGNYLERHIVFRNDNDKVEYEKDLHSQFSTIDAARKSGIFHRNSGACDDFGSLCQFFSPCMEGKESLMELYRKRDRKFPELSKEISDDPKNNQS